MVLFKGDYVEKIANDLNISKKVVDDVIGSLYSEYAKRRQVYEVSQCVPY